MVIGLSGIQFREQLGQSIATVHIITKTNITRLAINKKSINRNEKDNGSDNDHDKNMV